MTDPGDTLARTERRELCDLLDDAGPDAPTLCEGWTTYDLVAHLVTREGRLDAGPGIVFRPLAGWTETVRRRAKRTPYAELVRRFRGGPPVWSPYALPGMDDAGNAIELFVHHEDVRRAAGGWEPRSLPERHEDELWRRMRRTAPLLLRHAGVGVELRRPDGTSVTGRTGQPVVTVTGRPGELVLYVFGRRDHARVDVDGDPGAVARLDAARLGV